MTLWGQDKLVSSGITGENLARYVFLKSRSEFDDEVQAFGYQTAINSRGWLHSTADVIDEVLEGNYDAGVTSLRGFEKHKHLGLQMIDDSEFERALSPWVARKGFPAEVARDFVEALTNIQNEAFLLLVPGRPSGFSPVNEESFEKVRNAIKRIEGLFTSPVNQTNRSK